MPQAGAGPGRGRFDRSAPCLVSQGALLGGQPWLDRKAHALEYPACSGFVEGLAGALESAEITERTEASDSMDVRLVRRRVLTLADAKKLPLELPRRRHPILLDDLGNDALDDRVGVEQRFKKRLRPTVRGRRTRVVQLDKPPL